MKKELEAIYGRTSGRNENDRQESRMKNTSLYHVWQIVLQLLGVVKNIGFQI